LLSDIKQQIVRSSVVICLPGTRSSFVESEVSLAYGLSKPLVFVLSQELSTRLPNTAKRGYPIFDLELLRRARWNPLCGFVAYIARSVHSTARIYAAAAENATRLAAVMAVGYATLVLAGTAFVEELSSIHEPAFTSWLREAITHPLTITFVTLGVGALSLPLGLLVLSRTLARMDVRSAVSRRRFDLRLLPTLLESGLTAADLGQVQFKGVPLAHHDIGSQRPTRPSTVIRLNRGKLFLQGVLIPPFAWLFWAAFLEDMYFRHYGHRSWFEWLFLIWFSLIVVIALWSPTLIYRAFVGKDFIVGPDGMLGEQIMSGSGLLEWSAVESVCLNDDKTKLELHCKASESQVEIDLDDYSVQPSVLLELVGDYLRDARSNLNDLEAPARDAAA
jgi:hypothetical protein